MPVLLPHLQSPGDEEWVGVGNRDVEMVPNLCKRSGSDSMKRELKYDRVVDLEENVAPGYVFMDSNSTTRTDNCHG